MTLTSRWFGPSARLPGRRSRSDPTGRGLRVTILNWRDTVHPEGGGSERYVERIAAGLARRGCEVVIRCARYPGSTAVEHRDGFVLRRAGGRFTVYPRALLGLVADRFLGRRPEVLLDVQNGVPFFGRLVAGCPVVVLVHHVHREQWPVALGPIAARIGWWLESRVAPLVHRGLQYVTVSEVTRAELAELGIDRERIAVIHNGTDPIMTHPAPAAPATRARRGEPAGAPADTAPSLVVLGRLVPHKRVEHAVGVLARLRPRYPGLRLRVVGEGWWHERVVEEAQRLGVEAAVDFLGFVSEADKHAVLARSTVMLVPSLKEGWGLVVIEAAQHGVPTVAYRNAGGLSESVLDGSTGLLVDDFEGMVAATERLLRDGGLLESMGEIARAHAARFTWAAATTSFETVLRRSAQGLAPLGGESAELRRSAQGLAPLGGESADAGAAASVLLVPVLEDPVGRPVLDLTGGAGDLRWGHVADQYGRRRDGRASATQRGQHGQDERHGDPASIASGSGHDTSLTI
jgi:glycosyltransferase involved in cell wall biosynthesis